MRQLPQAGWWRVAPAELNLSQEGAPAVGLSGGSEGTWVELASSPVQSVGDHSPGRSGPPPGRWSCKMDIGPFLVVF